MGYANEKIEVYCRRSNHFGDQQAVDEAAIARLRMQIEQLVEADAEIKSVVLWVERRDL